MQGGENWVTILDHPANIEKLQDKKERRILTVMGSILMMYLKVTVSKATFLLFQITLYECKLKTSPTPQKNPHSYL